MIKIKFIFICAVAILSLSFAEEQCQENVIDTTIWPPPYTIYLNTTENFTIIELDSSTGAKCTDGSNYQYYYIPGVGSGAKKFMFFFSWRRVLWI